MSDPLLKYRELAAMAVMALDEIEATDKPGPRDQISGILLIISELEICLIAKREEGGAVRVGRQHHKGKSPRQIAFMGFLAGTYYGILEDATYFMARRDPVHRESKSGRPGVVKVGSPFHLTRLERKNITREIWDEEGRYGQRD